MATTPQTFTDVQPIQQTFGSVTPIDQASQAPTLWDKFKSYLADSHAKVQQLNSDAQNMSQQDFTAKYGPVEGVPIGAPPSAGVGALAAATGLQRFAEGKGQGETTGQAALHGAEAAGGTYVAGKALPAIVNTVAGALPSAKIAGAVQNFKELEGAIGEHTVPITDEIGQALSAMKEGIDTGLNAPSVVNKFVSRIADTDQPPLTYTEARKFYSNLGDLAASDRMAANGKMQYLINQLRTSLGSSIADTADQAGKLSQYQSAMQDFAKGSKMQDIGTEVGKLAKRVGVGALFGAGGTMAYNAYQKIFGQ